jgi:hypothetical protein
LRLLDWIGCSTSKAWKSLVLRSTRELCGTGEVSQIWDVHSWTLPLGTLAAKVLI